MGNLLCCLSTCCSLAPAPPLKKLLKSLPSPISSRISHATLSLNIARLQYASLLLFAFILSILLRNDLFGLWQKIQIRNSYTATCQYIFDTLHSTCDGNYIVLRISFACFAFFAAHAVMASYPMGLILTPRIQLLMQYNFCVKVPLFLLLLIVAFFVPNAFFLGYGWFALVASAVFITLQLLLIVDFAFEWQESWIRKGASDDDLGYDSDDEQQGCCSGMTPWMWLMFVASFVFFAVGLGIYVLQLFLFGTADASCHLNRFFICFALVLGIVVSVVSLLLGRGILPPSIVFCFSSLTVLSALLSEPANVCSRLQSHDTFSSGQTWLSYLSAAFLILVAAFSLIRTAVMTGLSASKIFKMSKKTSGDDTDSDSAFRDAYSEISDDSQLANGALDEDDLQLMRTQASQMFWSHVVFTFASCFMAMVLTNWKIEEARPFHDDTTKWSQSDVSWFAVWLKVVSGWIMYGLFVWACVAPKLLGRWRDFE